ncbi:hypothetical protein EJ110_NYTH42493 [Nymphaea thermarum]|nr:hypothetical protein EJ110_NYTH42493 [Nymphaea thermarum]
MASALTDTQILHIACGISDTSVDAYGNTWVGDSTFIASGSVVRVESQDRRLTAVRCFPIAGASCYSIPVTTPGSSITVAAGFNYGNYDGQNTPPSFKLQIQGGDWFAIKTSMGPDWTNQMTYSDVGSTISVCLEPDDTRRWPFISAIDISPASAINILSPTSSIGST